MDLVLIKITATMSHLHQLHEVFKEHLLVDGELAVVVNDAVVLHLSFAADTQRVIAGKVGALAHQEQACFRRVQQTLRLIPCYLPMKPSGRRRAGELPRKPRNTETHTIHTVILVHSSNIKWLIVSL